ncbi:MAG: C4-type zinc ribbon domain-containing protein [Nitrospinota bacterium]|nr:C4-type zinc ribbon domain-containing protein [Nitrospinota bacterium]
MNEETEKREKEQIQLKLLVGLQVKDNEINDLKKSLEIIPGQIASGQKELEGKKSKLNALQAEIDSLKKQRSQLEQDAKAEADHMAKTKMKLPTVKTNKEYTAILHETDAIKTKITEIEDKELEVMELLDAKEQEIPGLEAEFKGEEIQFKEYKQKKEAEKARIQKELADAEAQRTQFGQEIDPKLLSQYNRVSQARDNLGVVEIKGETCQGCHQNLQPQVALEVRAGEKVHQCQSCDRFLYFIPEPEPQTESAVPK